MTNTSLTEIDFDDFQAIEKHPVGITIKQGTFRINLSSIGMASDVADRYRASQDAPAIISMKYSPKAKAFLFAKETEATRGFVFSRNGKNTAAVQANSLPRALKDMKAPRGVYQRSEDNPDLYLLVDEDFRSEEELLDKLNPADKYFDEAPAAVGDTVSAIVDARHKGEGSRIDLMVTGVVEEIYPDPINPEKIKARIQPINKAWLDRNKTKTTTTILTSKLIVRERADG